jgi:glyoxylase I family protein
MFVKGIHHIGISVPNLEEAIEFYCGVIGFSPQLGWDFEPNDAIDRVSGLKNAAARSMMINAGNVYLEVFEFSSPTPKPQNEPRPVCDHGYTHIALEVNIEDIHEVYQRLEEGGVEWHTPINEETDEGEHIMMTYGRDPFGNVIEIQALQEDSGTHVSRLPRWK